MATGQFCVFLIVYLSIKTCFLTNLNTDLYHMWGAPLKKKIVEMRLATSSMVFFTIFFITETVLLRSLRSNQSITIDINRVRIPRIIIITYNDIIYSSGLAN